jgi:SAM-dependent methyltransferase
MRELYDRVWKRKELIGKGNIRVEECIKICKGGDIVLDIGSGATYLPGLLKDKYNTIVGIDISLVALRKYCSVSVLNDLNDGLSFLSNSVDCVICLDVLDYVFDVELVVQEIYRVLKNSGEFIVSFPNVRNVNQIIKLIRGYGPKTSGDVEGWDGGHVHYFTSRDIFELLVKVGFDVDIIKGLYNRKLKRRWLFGEKICREFFSGGILMRGVKT